MRWTLRAGAVHHGGVVLALTMLACKTQPWPRGAACACTEGQGVTLCERDGTCTYCQCLVPEATWEAPAGERFDLEPGALPDWSDVNAALTSGPVQVHFSGELDEKLLVDRWSTSEHRLFLVGNDAIVPGIGTGYDVQPVHRVTVTGFEVTGSTDKGVQWRAGDGIVIADNLIHDNQGSPAVSLDYSSRGEHAAQGFHVLANHVWNQRGECIYIGGSEGDDAPSHDDVRVEDNLVHDCWVGLESEHDGINLKDRLTNVVVRRNVIFNVDWGIETASPGLYAHNLVLQTNRNGFHLTDGWGTGLGGAVLRDNAVVDAGHAGVYLNASEHRWEALEIDGLVVVGAGGAGLEAGGERGISGTLDDVTVVDSDVGFDAWDPMDLELGSCLVWDNRLRDDRDWEGLADHCERVEPGFGDLSEPAGPDHLFFTDDDPWR